jgi:hypothetical protein
VSAHPPHGYRSAVAYSPATKTWITVGPNGTDISTDDGRNWRALTPTPPGRTRRRQKLERPLPALRRRPQRPHRQTPPRRTKPHPTGPPMIHHQTRTSPNHLYGGVVPVPPVPPGVVPPGTPPAGGLPLPVGAPPTPEFIPEAVPSEVALVEAGPPPNKLTFAFNCSIRGS